MPPPRIVAVEPELSRTLSGGAHHNGHGVTGIGAGVPLAFVRPRGAAAASSDDARVAADDYRSCPLADALDAARDLATRDGVLCGPSSGAALKVARELAAELGAGRRVAVVLPSAGERYLTHPLFDARRREALGELGRLDTAVDDERELAKLAAVAPPSAPAPSAKAAARVEARAALETELAGLAAAILQVDAVPPDARLEDLGATLRDGAVPKRVSSWKCAHPCRNVATCDRPAHFGSRARSLTAARLLGKLARGDRAAELSRGGLPGAKVALLKVALLGSVRDLARVVLRLDADDAPLAGRVATGVRVHVDYCGG